MAMRDVNARMGGDELGNKFYQVGVGKWLYGGVMWWEKACISLLL